MASSGDSKSKLDHQRRPKEGAKIVLGRILGWTGNSFLGFPEHTFWEDFRCFLGTCFPRDSETNFGEDFASFVFVILILLFGHFLTTEVQVKISILANI